jgi:putative transposase
VAYIDAHRDRFGVESICRVLPIAPSTYHRHRWQQVEPTRQSARAQRDDTLRPEIQRVWDENHQVYGPRKVWKQLKREGFRVARCTVGRLMRDMGVRGAVRGRAWITTTHAGEGARPRDLVDRQFVATRPDSSGYRTSRMSRRGAASCSSPSSSTCSRGASSAGGCRRRCGQTVLDALEQAIHARGHDALTGLVHHSDQGVQYLSMRYTDRLADAGIAPSVGSCGDAYDNALAESVIGLFKTEVIQRKRPWRSLEGVEFATLVWVDWFNHRRLLGPIGDIPPAEFEAQYYAQAKVA